MKHVIGVAFNELRLLARSGAVAGGLGLVAALMVLALALSLAKQGEIQEERARLTALAEEAWAAQPDRHPHRVVHFGDFVFRPISWLAAFDLGAEAFAGHALFLEGHRQNPSNFSEAGAAGAIRRFSQLTPAFVLHTLTPLLLLFVGAGTVAGERRSRRLALLISLGVGRGSLLFGKSLALFALGLLLLAPAGVWLFVSAASAASGGDSLRRALLLLAGSLVHLLIWSAGVVLVSSLARSRRTALLALLGLWFTSVIAIPRLGASLAPLERPAPTRAESEIAAARDLAEIGDSHNPDDPYFGALRERTLAEQGVERVEDLPFNFGGLVMLEGERLTTELYNRRFQETVSRLREQSQWVARVAWLTPFQALRNLSQRAAGVDLEHLLHFLAEGEKRRYAMVQALNELHRREIRFENDRGQRLEASRWAEIPRQPYRPPTLDELPGAGGGGLGQLAVWAALVLSTLFLAARSR